MCANGLVSFEIQPAPSLGFPPAPYVPGYRVQPCDTVTWDFGDGTTGIVTGAASVVHNFLLPGNYTIRATVTNALGSKTVSTPAIAIANSPTVLSFVTRDIRIDAGVLQPETYQCYSCVVAGEQSGSVVIEVARTLDLSRTISASVVVQELNPDLWLPVTFGPGETRKSVTVPIANDSVFRGHPRYPLYMGNLTGGTIQRFTTAGGESLLILDDDPRPVFSMPPRYSIREGDAGETKVSVPVSLSPALPFELWVDIAVLGRSATPAEDFVGSITVPVPAGSTSFSADAWIQGDRRPERDEEFVVRFAPRNQSFGMTDTIVTIVNDDAAFAPKSLSLTSETTGTLAIDIGSPYAVPATITFASSAPHVVAAPLPVTIPAGQTTVNVRVAGGVYNGTAEIIATVSDRSIAPAQITVTGGLQMRRRSSRH